MRAICALAVASSLYAPAASAATRIDVDNLLFPTAAASSHQGLVARSMVTAPNEYFSHVMQTWTVGVSGKLDRLDMVSDARSYRGIDFETFVEDDVDFLVTLSILGGATAFSPGYQLLGSVSRYASEIPRDGLSSFDLSEFGISAEKGDILTWRMSVERCNTGYFCSNDWSTARTLYDGTTSDGLSGGRAYSDTQAGLFGWPDYDLNFRTWMSAVPEPTTWAMMIVGFGAVGSMVRTTRRRSAFSAA